MSFKKRKATRKRGKAPNSPKSGKKALIFLRAKPKRPHRLEIKERVTIGIGDRLNTLLEQLGHQGDDPWNDIYFETSYYIDDESCDTDICFDRMQTDAELNNDIVRYEKRLAKYDEWYKENEEVILAEIDRRKEKAKKQEWEAIKKAQVALDKKLSKLAKRNG